MRKALDAHLSAEEIALLIEGNAADLDMVRIVRHLRMCGRCFEVFRDSSRYSGILAEDPRTFESNRDLAVLGLQAASEAESGTGARTSTRRWEVLRPRRRLVAAGATLGLVATLVGVSWLRHAQGPGSPGIARSLVQPVRVAIGEVSARGPIVIPGGEGRPSQPPDVYRSGFFAREDSLSRALDELMRRYQAGDTSREVAYWLVAGLFATGRLSAARDYAREARLLHPEDAEIAVVSALILNAAGGPDEAERLLREVVERDPRNVVARLDLGVVLLDRGAEDEARAALEKVRDESPRSPAADRARSLLRELP